MRLSRRALLACLPVGPLLSLTAMAASRHKSARSNTPKAKASREAAQTDVPKPTGTKLPIPPLVEPASGATWELKAVAANHMFAGGHEQEIATFGGSYPGPTIRLKRGETTHPQLVNRLDRPTNLHWHGLIVDPQADAGHLSLAPGETWTAALAVDQPAASLWYHEQMAEPVDRPAGCLIIDDPALGDLGLPKSYGVDDFPLILDDRSFDDPSTAPHAALAGRHGSTILVNGVTDALLTVPQRLVRLRLVNAARARVFRLYLDDERPFHYIAGDGGYHAEPIEIDTLNLAPGERAEILVNFADGSTSLQSTPDTVVLRAGNETATVADPIEKPFRVIAFEAVKDGAASQAVPAKLPARPILPPPDDVVHRRFEITVSEGEGGASPLVAAINGKPFDPARIDATVACGKVEIWQLVAADMAHPIHIEGTQFHVLSEAGGRPRAWNRGAKDTVLVESTVDIQVTYTIRTPLRDPFRIVSTIADHRIAGAAATITTV